MFQPSEINSLWHILYFHLVVKKMWKSSVSHSVRPHIFLHHWVDKKNSFFLQVIIYNFEQSLFSVRMVSIHWRVKNKYNSLYLSKNPQPLLQTKTNTKLCFLCFSLFPLKGDNPGWEQKCWLSKGCRLAIIDIMMDTRYVIGQWRCHGSSSELRRINPQCYGKFWYKINVLHICYK